MFRSASYRVQCKGHASSVLSRFCCYRRSVVLALAFALYMGKFWELLGIFDDFRALLGFLFGFEMTTDPCQHRFWYTILRLWVEHRLCWLYLRCETESVGGTSCIDIIFTPCVAILEHTVPVVHERFHYIVTLLGEPTAVRQTSFDHVCVSKGHIMLTRFAFPTCWGH